MKTEKTSLSRNKKQILEYQSTSSLQYCNFIIASSTQDPIWGFSEILFQQTNVANLPKRS